MTSDDSKPLPKGVIRSRSTESVIPSATTRSVTDTGDNSPRDSLAPRNGGKGARGEGGTRAKGPLPEGRITAIEPQVRHKDRVNVYVDGTFAIGLFEDVVVALGLKLGQEVTPERLIELADAENRRKAREDSYRLLSFRARTEKEIVDRLKRREYEEEVIADTVRYLHEQHLLDDADFAARFAASRSRTHGDRAIAIELRQKGVAPETIKETLAESADENSARDAVMNLAVKRVGEHPVDTSPRAKQKLWAFLARRGFGSDTIKRVIADLYNGISYDDDE